MRNLSIVLLLGLVCVSLSAPLDCGKGSVINYQGVCITPKYIEGCTLYDSTNTCYECGYNYALLNGKCQFQISNSRPCCRVRNSLTGQCTQCESGLFLKNGKCVDNKIIGCLAQDQKGVCLNCDNRFYLQDGVCKYGIPNCLDYTIMGEMKVCNQCKAGHSFINNACVPNTILGCKAQLNNQCSECYQPFILKNNHCQVANCKSHNDFGCTVCECGYYITQDRRCNQMSNGCIRYNRGVCTDCMKYFVLKGNVCDIEGCSQIQGAKCLQCKEGYEAVGQGCQMFNCLLSSNGFCSVCKDGFRQKDGICIKQTAPTIQQR